MVHASGISYRRLLIVAAVLSVLNLSCGSKDDAKLPMGAVDVPRAGQTIAGHVAAVGWAVSEDRVTDVSVYIDRTFWRKCNIHGTRLDVGKIYPNFPEGDDAGFTVDLDASALPEGTHELEFQARSSKGAVRDLGDVSVLISH
jgi:Bacterial Ig domain